MIINLITILLFLLPWLEGDLKIYGYIFLLIMSGLIGFYSSKKIKFDHFDYLFLLFLIFASLSTILSTGVSRSFLELLRYISYFIIFITIRRLNITKLSKLKNIYIFVILLNSLLLSIVSFSFLFHKPFLPIPSNGMNLYYAVFGHNNLVSLLLFALPITYLLISKFNNKSNNRKKILISLFIFYCFSFIFTFSKAGYLVIIFTFLLITKVFNNKFKFLQEKSKVLLILFIPVFLFFIFIVTNTYFLKLKERPFYSQISKPLYMDWRWDYYRAAMEGLKQSPFIGVGLDNFRYLSKLYQSKPYSWSDYGENYYLTFLSEVGLFGGLSMFILLFAIFRKLYKYITNENNLIDYGIYFAIVASALHVVFSDDWYFLSIYLYFWVGVALLLPSNVNEQVINRRKNYQLKLISILLVLIAFFYSTGKLTYHFADKYKSNFLFQTASLFNYFDLQTQLEIGTYYKSKQDLHSAIYYYDIAKRLEPKDYTSYLAIGNILEVQGDSQGAVNNYISAINIDPLDLSGYIYKIYQIYLREVDIYLKGQKYNQALDLIFALKDRFPTQFTATDTDKYFQLTKNEISKKNKKEVLQKMENLVTRGLEHKIKL